jgi:hypothetical protein
MISVMRARVSSRTNGDSLMTRDTVFFETLARRAMSLMVCLRSALTMAACSAARECASGRAFGCGRTILVADFLGMLRVELCRIDGARAG